MTDRYDCICSGYYEFVTHIIDTFHRVAELRQCKRCKRIEVFNIETDK